MFIKAQAQVQSSVNCNLESQISTEYTFQLIRTVNGSSTTIPQTSPIPSDDYNCPYGGCRVSSIEEPTLSAAGVHDVFTTKDGDGAIKIGRLTMANPYQFNDQSLVRHSVELAGPIVSFDYSLVFMFPTDITGRPSTFLARLRNEKGEIVDELQIRAEPNNCIFTKVGTAPNEFLYTGWQCATLDASSVWFSSESHTVRLEFIINEKTGITNNLTGTAYIDNIGCPSSALCPTNSYGNIEFNNYNISCPVAGATLRGTITAPESNNWTNLTLSSLRFNVGSITVDATNVNWNGNVCNFEFPIPSSTGSINTTVTAIYNFSCPASGTMTVMQTGPTINYDCCSSTQLVIHDPVMSYSNKQSQTSILADNHIYAGLDSSALYHAGDFIELNKNFETIGDAHFSAYIEPCTSSFLYRQLGSNGESTPYDTAEQLIEIYPNPFSDKISISSKLPLVSYAVYAMDGKEVLSQKAPGRLTWDLDLANLSVGIYVIRLENMDHSIETRKIIKR
ncbi:MAG TPA: T9SS type A sorting domain-containing protein [Flavobacterium sp.]|nr:T9SS type A sorting domain-containing protein [Flavobacterium sp.]